MIILKTKEELEILYRANQIVACILKELSLLCKEGVSTWDLEERARELVSKYNVKPAFYGYRGYPCYLCASINEEIVHGIPKRERVLKSGDIISLDFGVILEGYYGDSAITVEVGEVKSEISKLVRTTKEALDRAIERCEPGKRLSDITHAIQSFVEANGFSVVRQFVGHGIGRDMHEEPQIPNYGIPKPNPRIKEGMVLALEPMVNMGSWEALIKEDGWTAVTADGKPSAHFEHSVAITDNGPWVLSRKN